MTNCARVGGCAGSNYPFLTQKERDIETGLDYFEARYYSSLQGRFTSADSVGSSPHHPQSLNLYSYTTRNPLRFIDPSGNTAEDPHGEQIDKPKDGCGTDKGSLCLWKGQDPPKRTGQPPTPIGTNGEILTDADVLVIDAKPAFPGLPSDNPGETPFERYAFSPKQTALEVVDWASKGVRKFGYAIVPDYVFLNFGVPLVASGSLQYSKDRQGYYSFAGPTAGAKNFKVGGQLGIAYFATTQMKPEQRDAAIQGPGLNVTTPFTPVGAYFPSGISMRIILAVAALLVFFTGCNPWRLPGLKEEAKRQDERITRETDEAIKKSPQLQELNSLCTEKIPRPSGFELVNKDRDYHQETFISYGYRSALDYQSVKRFYLDYFAQNGWELTKQKDDGWGPSEIEFRNDSYSVTIYDMGRGEEENYGIVCAKLR